MTSLPPTPVTKDEEETDSRYESFIFNIVPVILVAAMIIGVGALLVVPIIHFSSLSPIDKLRWSAVGTKEICAPLYDDSPLSESEGELVINGDVFINKVSVDPREHASRNLYIEKCGFESYDSKRTNAYALTFVTASGEIETVTVPERFAKFKQGSSEQTPTVKVKYLEKLDSKGLYEITIPVEEYSKITAEVN